MNRVKGNEIYIDPYVDKPVEVPADEPADESEEPVIEKMPKTGADWTKSLKGKQFTDDDSIRYEIVKIVYGASQKQFNCLFIKLGDKSISKNTETQLLKEVLDLSTGEDWFSPLYLEYKK